VAEAGGGTDAISGVGYHRIREGAAVRGIRSLSSSK